MEKLVNELVKAGLDNVPWVGTVTLLIWVIIKMYLSGIVRRIDKLESDTRACKVHDDLTDIRERLAAIEAKLDIPITVKCK